MCRDDICLLGVGVHGFQKGSRSNFFYNKYGQAGGLHRGLSHTPDPAFSMVTFAFPYKFMKGFKKSNLSALSCTSNNPP